MIEIVVHEAHPFSDLNHHISNDDPTQQQRFYVVQFLRSPSASAEPNTWFTLLSEMICFCFSFTLSRWFTTHSCRHRARRKGMAMGSTHLPLDSTSFLHFLLYIHTKIIWCSWQFIYSGLRFVRVHSCLQWECGIERACKRNILNLHKILLLAINNTARMRMSNDGTIIHFIIYGISFRFGWFFFFVLVILFAFCVRVCVCRSSPLCSPDLDAWAFIPNILLELSTCIEFSFIPL